MRKVTKKDWLTYKNKLAQISQKATDELTTWIEAHGGIGVANQDDLIAYAYALTIKYGEASGTYTAQYYDDMARLSGVTVPSAEIADLPSYGEVAKAINGTIKQSKKSSYIGSTSGRLVKQVSADTLQKNALRDGAQWAWIPAGDTCVFCLTLASRGWQNASKKALKNGHAEHIHANCDCTYAVRFDRNTDVEGYEPEKYLEMYENAEGNTPQEKINSMRRIQYQANLEKYREQKRNAYEERNRILNYGDSKDFVRGTQTIKASPVNKYSDNNIYVADNLKLKNSEVRYVNKRISEAKTILGIGEECDIPVVIVEDNDNLASYNPRTNILYVSSRMTNVQNVIMLQEGYAASDNQNSTTIHELIHWKDAENYRKNIGFIESAEPNSEYTVYQRNMALKKLKEEGVDIANDKELIKISRYAFQKSIENDYEEIYTEFRTNKVLGR